MTLPNPNRITEAGYTPGPWVVTKERTENAVWLWILPENGKTRVCRVVVYDGEEVEQRANARLIAAAPDLLRLARDFRQFCYEEWHSYMSQEQFDNDPTIKDIDAIIAKATGGAP